MIIEKAVLICAELVCFFGVAILVLSVTELLTHLEEVRNEIQGFFDKDD